ncbi:MAG: nickel-dependent hydrogenase large subunit [bacterium]|nr:nickel-dependent hydrogenase large subunit [bacterium]
MSERTVIPFGPQHPVLPEPIHLDLVMEDERVVQAIPQLGFIHRGLERLVKTRDYMHFVYVTERICGICSFGHSYGYSQTIERLMGIEVPMRAEYLRVIWFELSRIHSHLLWMGLAADSFGYENLFYQCWRLRERVLDIFEKTTGGRVILSACNVGGVNYDIDNSELAGISQIIQKLKRDAKPLIKALVKDRSIKDRLVGSGYLSQEDAVKLSIVGPFARASGVEEDIRMFGVGGYGELAEFKPQTSTQGDNYARVAVRCNELLQSCDIICEMIDKIPDGPICEKPKGNPPEAQGIGRVEQPRGEVVYYVKGNGTRFLERFRIRTPTSQNVAGMVQLLQGCELSEVPLNILTIDPCISCTER